MTWYFDPSGKTVDIYDHTGSQVSSGRQFSGSWSGDFPEVVLTVMNEEYTDAINSGDIIAALKINEDATFENIEEGSP